MTSEDVEGRPESATLADKINRLFEVMHSRAERPPSNEEVAAAINARGRTTISASYLWLLRTGKRDNPGKHHLEAIADYFKVPPAYFFDQEVSAEIDAELTLLAAMRDAGVRQIALRAAGLSADSLQALALMIEQARRVERLENDGPAGH